MKFRFRAVYHDGTTLEEYPGQTSYHDIDRARLHYFDLFDLERGNVWLRVKVEPGQRLVWRRRKQFAAGVEQTVHIVGKWQKIDQHKVQSLALLYDDGSVECFEKFNPHHPFLKEIQLLPEE